LNKLDTKVNNAKQIIEEAISTYPETRLGCSFGKDSMVVLDIARTVKPDISVFSIMTMFKPKETFSYLQNIQDAWALNMIVYIVGYSSKLTYGNVVSLPGDKFFEADKKAGPLYYTNPDECCNLLKVEPTRVALEHYDAWITGLRNTEGPTRVDYKEKEDWGLLTKYNPILTFTEEEIWEYINNREIPVHPWYQAGYRSLGCAPCTTKGGTNERDGRWSTTSKCGGECGIHSKRLK